jgi:hypothetical protein
MGRPWARPSSRARRSSSEPVCGTALLDALGGTFESLARDRSTAALALGIGLRAEAGRDPYDRQLSDLIGELSTRSEEFRVRWAAHDVRTHTTGVKRLHHPVVGDLDLPFESFPLAADPSQSLLTYTAEPRSPSQDALNLLASWAATTDDFEQPASTDEPELAEPLDTPD